MIHEKRIYSNAFKDTEVAFRYMDTRTLKRAYWLFKLMSKRWLPTVGLSLLNLAIKLRVPVKGIIRETIFAHFCGGEDIDSCGVTISKLAVSNVGTILDYSVECGENDVAFDQTCEEILRTVRHAAGNPDIPFVVVKVTGLALFELLEKANAGIMLSPTERQQFDRVRARFDLICKSAHQFDVRVLVDAEHSWVQDVIDNFALAAMVRYNREKPIVYNTYQLYRHDKLTSLRADFEKAVEAGVHLGAKIVRGAYMELERDRANRTGYRSPIHIDKASVDADFDEAAMFCLQHIDQVGLVLGTHNEYSSQMLITQMACMGIPIDHPNVYFSQLLGMSDHITFNLAAGHFNAAKYVPYGPVKDVMPYLLRRARENTSVAGQSGRELSMLKKEIYRRKKK